jgi:hypothetical protein
MSCFYKKSKGAAAIIMDKSEVKTAPANGMYISQ